MSINLTVRSAIYEMCLYARGESPIKPTLETLQAILDWLSESQSDDLPSDVEEALLSLFRAAQAACDEGTLNNADIDETRAALRTIRGWFSERRY